jgi:N-acetylglutamate synthase-like GNAT family acetyltransferase
MKDIETFYLADQVDALPTVARWVFEEWGDTIPDLTLSKTEEVFRNRLNRDQFPMTLLAQHNSVPVGTACLQLEQMRTHKHLRHWLGCVFVEPEFRNKGIGMTLVSRAIAEATQLATDALYLYTHRHEDFWGQLGWSVIERTRYNDLDVVIMRNRLKEV